MSSENSEKRLAIILFDWSVVVIRNRLLTSLLVLLPTPPTLPSIAKKLWYLFDRIYLNTPCTPPSEIGCQVHYIGPPKHTVISALVCTCIFQSHCSTPINALYFIPGDLHNSPTATPLILGYHYRSNQDHYNGLWRTIIKMCDNWRFECFWWLMAVGATGQNQYTIKYMANKTDCVVIFWITATSLNLIRDSF